MKQYDVIVIGTGAGNIILDYALEKGLKAAKAAYLQKLWLRLRI